jgi:glucose-1-phosphate cytidylyltransferase
MKVVILCGGKGTRIRDVTENVPKPMISIGGLPILWHILKYYAHWGHKESILCLGYQGEVIKNFFLNYEAHTRDFTIKLNRSKQINYCGDFSEEDMEITLANTGLDSMTGTRVKRIYNYVRDQDNFLLTYGDGVGDINIKQLIEFHLSHGKILTITGVKPPGRFGELMSDTDGNVTEFNEKPQATGGMISGGFFVCRKEIFDYLDDKEDLVFEKGPMENLVSDKQMMVFNHEGFWQCMDTHREYMMLNDLCKNDVAPWIIW